MFFRLKRGHTYLVFILILPWITEINGFCVGYGCCLGHNSTCNIGGCFCDEYCLVAKDCCEDYNATCQEFNPCVQHTVRKNEVTRSSTFLSELPNNCDNHLNNSWYRFDMLTGSTMPTTCIVHGNCGTERPIWLNDSHPDEEEGIVNRTACMKETGNCCAKSYGIQIKNCSTFMVYRLPSVSDCPERYCIGDKVLCPPGYTSETGFQPGCTDIFPNITQIPEVSVGEGIRQNQWGKRFKEIVFKCDQQYGQIAEERRGELFFDVYWFFDGKKILEDEDVPTRNMPATLKESHWVGRHSLGFKVKCTVRAKFMKNGIIHGGRSAPLESVEFFAGLKVLNTLPIVLKESDVVSTEIKLQPTVPVLCSDLKLQSYCQEQLLPVEIRIPLVPKKRLCSSGERLEFVSEFDRTPCRLEIDAMNWNKTHTFKIAPVVDGVYDGHTNTKVMVHTGEFTTHPAWNDYTLPDIPVKVLDTDIDAAGQVCMSNNDPHMRTFDGNNYECQYGGEFVLYKHTTLPVQVHAFFKPCNGGYAYCNCAVSVMSGGDVFIVDTCKPGTGLEQITAKRPMRVGLVGCEDGQLRVESLNGGKHFKVYLHTGGYVDIMVYRYGHDDFMNVQIHPGAKDFNRTVGLCGTLNHDKSDDFLTKDGRTEPVSSNPKDFAMSWRVQPQYSIYNGPPSSQLQFSKRSTSRSNYCRCSAETNDANSIVQCGYAENIAKCPGDDNFSSREHQKCRRRRAAEESGQGHDDVLETRVFEYDIYHTVPEPSWKNNWTNATAAQFCESFMANTSTGKSCETVPGANTRDPIKGCIEDIYLTGSTEWAPAALQAIKSSCLGELEKNSSIWVTNNETGKVSLPEEMEAVQCPNECSGNGQCINGTCSCGDTFAGADCSIDRSAAPTIYYLPGDGLCKSRSRPCARSPVYGGTFLDNKNLTCKVEIQEVTAGEPQSSAAKVELMTAEFVHFQEVICPLPRPRQHKRSAECTGPHIYRYGISVSNNNAQFSNATHLITFDDKCVSCRNNDPNSCRLKSDACTIDCSCYADGEENVADRCCTCNITYSNSTWFRKPNTCSIDTQCYNDGETNPGSFCQFCSATDNDHGWSVKHDFCLIDGTCYALCQLDPKNSGKVCYPNASVHQWTATEVCKIKITSPPGVLQPPTIWIIGAVLGSLAFIVAVFGFGIFCCVHRRKIQRLKSKQASVSSHSPRTAEYPRPLPPRSALRPPSQLWRDDRLFAAQFNNRMYDHSSEDTPGAVNSWKEDRGLRDNRRGSPVYIPPPDYETNQYEVVS